MNVAATPRFPTTGRPPGVLLVVGQYERAVAARLRTDLRRRGFAVKTAEADTEMALDPALVGPEVISVVVVPYDPNSPHTGDRMLDHIAVISRSVAAMPPIVLADRADDRIARMSARMTQVIRYGEGQAEYDNLLSQLFTVLLGPFPSWLEARVHPSLVNAPTGVSWWGDDVVVADEHFGQVVLLAPEGERVLIAGLKEPHHLHLDRTKLLVADTGSHRVLTGSIDGGMLGGVETWKGDSKAFRKPNGVHQSHGLCAVADTDNHRVCVSGDDLWARPKPRWTSPHIDGGLRYPCGVLVDDRWLWVADTFNHRLAVCDHRGNFLCEFSGYGWDEQQFAYPTGLARWRDCLFIADAEPQRIQVLQVHGDDGPRPLLSETGLSEFAQPFIGTPFGLSVNRHGRLAVADRQRRCIWLVDLPAALGDVVVHDD